MSLRSIFSTLIDNGEDWTKTQLIYRLDQIKSYNTKTLVVIDDEEYNFILNMINTSNLPE